MSVTVADEAPRTAQDPTFRDAVTFSFGDPATQVYGLARLGLGGSGANGFGVIHSGTDLVDAATETAAAADLVDTWDAVRAAGVRTAVVTPLEEWTVSFEGAHGSFDLRFEAASSPAVLDPEGAVARLGGMEGYEQLCTVTGTVRVGRRAVDVNCLGQRGHLWGTPDWSRIELARTVSAWMGDDRAVFVTAVRPAKAKHHDEEEVAGFVFDSGQPLSVFDARLSTTYDEDLRQRRAGLELWMQEEGGMARRAAGEALSGTSMDLGEVRMDSAFFQWWMEGRQGVGRYDVLRRTGNGGKRRR